jgi:Tfp pilus tip-associated adhesin PilY1
MNIKPIKWCKNTLAALGCALASATLMAEDIDLFVGSSASVDPATVMLTWHTSANVSANAVHGCRYIGANGLATTVEPSLGADTVGGMEQCAIVNALQTVRNSPDLVGTLKVGVMTFSDSPGGCGNLLIPPTLLTTTGIDSMISTLKGLTKQTLPGNQSQLGDAVAETWAALNGLPTSCSGTDYSAIKETSTNCSNAVMIYIGNAVAANASVKDGNGNPGTKLKEQLTSAFGYSAGSSKYNEFATIRNGNGFNLTPADSYWGDEWTRFMRYVDVDDSTQIDRNVTTYSIAVYGESFVNQVADEIAFYQDMAKVGGGEAYLVKSTESDALTRVLLEIFNEVQDVNSVFSSATLPVSANTQGTYENQIYIAMFRPDPSGGPRWIGNVKQFQFGVDDAGSIVLTDADDSTTGSNSIVNSETGGLVDDALSFWTTNTPSNSANWPALPDGFWKNSPEGDGGARDAPDGDLVQKGGAAQMLRVDYLTNSGARRVYTNKCPSGSCGANGLANFDTSNSALTAYFTTTLSASSKDSISSITAGARGTVNGSVSCTKDKGVSSCVYSLTNIVMTSGSAFDFNASNDAVLLDSDIPGGASCSSSPCSLTASGANSFTVAFSGSNKIEGNFTFTAKPITKVSKLIKVNQSEHGISSGTTNAQKTLDNCQITGNTAGVYNSAGVTGSVVLSGGTYVDSDNFTGRLETWVFTSGASVTCGTSGDTLTAENLINWVRGDDIAGNEAMTGPCPQGSRDSNCPISIRGSVHGDVLHSRPAVVNYGSGTGVVVYYGANDGHFRAINGNQTAVMSNGAGGSVRPGGELWSFVAKDFLDQFPRLFRDDPAIRFPDTPASSTAERRKYFFDGTTTFFQDDRATSATSGHKYLYLSSRRGGRFMYAMNVTNPFAPSVMWKLDNTIINELGYTWSQPKVTKIGGRDRPVLIFGAGYSPEQDADPVVAADTMGRGVVILDGITGKIIWASLYSCAGIGSSHYASVTTEGVAGTCVANINLTSAFAADITFLDRRGDGYTDRLYASDVGGNIWRVDLDKTDSYTATGNSVAVSDIAISKFASLASAGNGKRKFLYGVDIIPTRNHDLVVAVSGDREHPLYTSSTTAGTAQNVQNRFYMLIDRNTGPSAGSTTAINNSNLLNQTDVSANCFDSVNGGYEASATDNAAVACSSTNTKRYVFDGRDTNYKGYYFDLAVGEKGVNAPLTEAGTVYFATNQPDTRTDSTSCKSGLGRAFAYKVDLFTGSRTSTEYSGGGLPPSPISGLVNLNDEIRFFIMGGDGDSIYKPSNGKVISSGRKRMYYFYK